MFTISLKQKRWLLLLQITISATALFYVVHKILIFEHWNNFFYWINDNNKTFIWLIIIQLLLSFINISLETLKWRLLTSLLERSTFFESLKQVLNGILIGMLTPAKLGEPFGKAMLLKKGNRLQGIILSFAGSVFQNIIIIVAGITAFFVLQKYFFRFGSLYPILMEKIVFYVFLPTIVVIPILWAAYKLLLSWKKKSRISRVGLYLRVLKKIDRRKLAKYLLFTTLRYLIFVFQFWIVLKFFNIIEIPLQLWLIPFYYLIITFLPTVAFADLGVRSSAALLIFGMVSDNSAAILSSTLIIWLFNMALPAMSNFFLKFLPKSILKKSIFVNL